MSMADYEAAVRLVREHPELVSLAGRPCSETRIAEAERALGLRFPPTYRRFLGELGSISLVGIEDIYGIEPDGPIDAPASEAARWTLEDRAAGWLAPKLVVIARDGMGGHYVLDGRTAPPGAEYPVAVWELGTSRPDDRLEQVGPDFGAFFRDVVEYPDNW